MAPPTPDTIDIPDDSVYAICSAEGISLGGQTGQVYNVYLTEGEADAIYPGGWGAISAGGGGNPSGNVAVTQQTVAKGYTPTLTTDGAALSSAKGGWLTLDPGAGTWVDGQPILCWQYSPTDRGGVWTRAIENDQAVPTGANALGAGAVLTFPDLQYTVGQTGRRTMFVPASGATTGAAGFVFTMAVQS